MLTTQYLEEADQLADRIVVIDDGKVIAEGTATELKSRVGNDHLELSFADEKLYKKAQVLLGKKIIEANNKDLSVIVIIKDTNKDVKQTLDALAAAKITVKSMAIHKPTLDDVFLALTGKQKKLETQDDTKEGK